MALKSCPECGEEISDKAKTCPNCGVKSRAKSIGVFEILAIGFVVIAAAGFFPKTVVHPATTSLNPTNDLLLSLSPKEQAEKLGKVVELFGDACKGKTAFYMGKAEDHAAFWSVRCTNGNSYQAEIRPDGTGGIVECSIMRDIVRVPCFKKFSRQ
jgi:hypothetical protein